MKYVGLPLSLDIFTDICIAYLEIVPFEMIRTVF